MKGLIVQQAKIFDPRALPDYVGVAHMSAPGIDRDAFHSHLSTMGKALYPHTIEYLQRLNISDISGLKDAHENYGRREIVQMPRGIVDLNGLKENLGDIAAAWIQFDARIRPFVAVGTEYVRILMTYSSEDSWEGPRANRDRRAIKIAAKFLDPQAARVGLRQLGTIFPEMLFEEELYTGKLPEEIENLQDNSIISSRAMRYLSPSLQSVGVVPYAAEVPARHFDASSKGMQTIPVTNFDEVADIEDKYGWNPEIYATFEGKELELQFSQLAWNLTFPEDGGFYLKIRNKGTEGTLEDILERALNL